MLPMIPRHPQRADDDHEEHGKEDEKGQQREAPLPFFDNDPMKHGGYLAAVFVIAAAGVTFSDLPSFWR